MAYTPSYLLSGATQGAIGAGFDLSSLASRNLFQVTVDVDGTLGTATVQIERCSSPIDTADGLCNWKPMTDALFSATGFQTMFISASKIRAVVIGGDATTSVTVSVI